MMISQTSGFRFFVRMATAAIVDLQNFKILIVGTVKMTICITLPSLAVISQTISGLWRSCNFENGGGRCLVFLNFRNFNDRKGQEGQTASVYKISCNSVKQMLRYGDFSRWWPPPSKKP